MSERGAVLRRIDQPFAIEEIELAPIRADQVRVRIAASGVCHSDLSSATGALPAAVPCVLGHEGAGIVEEVGSEVHHLEPGDHVVISWTAACKQCWYCRHGDFHLCARAVQDVYSMPYATDRTGAALFPVMGVSSFATATNCLGRAAIKIDERIPLDIASLIGCGVSTGAGAALYSAPVPLGGSVAVFGLGGVGMSSLLGAIARGAATIVAIDPVAERREAALKLGATDAIDPAVNDVVAAVKDLTEGRGADVVFEAVGRPSVIEQAIAAARRGGTACVVGASPPGSTITVDPYELTLNAKTITGSQYGSVVPDRDFPMLLDLWERGRLPLDRLITRRVRLDDVQEAFDDLRTGAGLRTVIVNDDDA